MPCGYKAHSEEEPQALLLIKIATDEFAVLVEGRGALCGEIGKVDRGRDGDAAVALEVAVAQVVGELHELLHLELGSSCSGVGIRLVAEYMIARHPGRALQRGVGDEPEVCVAHYVSGRTRRNVGVKVGAASRVCGPLEQACEVSLLHNDEEEGGRDAKLLENTVNALNLRLADGLKGRVSDAIPIDAEPVRKVPLLAPVRVQLTYDLCHGHFKCNRSVSVPSPVYFADLAAERAVSLYEFNQGVRGKFLGGDFDEEQSLQSLRLFF